MLYWNHILKSLLRILFCVEPKQVLYWNIIYIAVEQKAIGWTQTSVVLKCNDYKSRIIESWVEPKQVLYWNFTREIYGIPYGKLNPNKCCIEMQKAKPDTTLKDVLNPNKCCIEILLHLYKLFYKDKLNPNKCCIEIP